MQINKRFVAFVFGVLVLGAVLAWFGVRSAAVAWDLTAPTKNPWMEVHLADGSVFYGKIDGVALGILRMSRVSFLDRYRSAAPEAVENGTSNTFSIGGAVTSPAERYIVDRKIGPLYINRSAISYWAPVDPAAPVAKYLE